TTQGALQRQPGGEGDGFVVALTDDLQAVRWLTYLGGSQAEMSDAGRLAVDPSGRVHLAITTGSADFPTHRPTQPRFGGGERDVAVVSLSSDGRSLLFSTWLGGSGDDVHRTMRYWSPSPP